MVYRGEPTPPYELYYSAYEGSRGWSTPTKVLEASGIHDTSLVTAEDGRIYVFWATSSDAGNDVFCAIYDAENRVFSNPHQMTEDVDSEWIVEGALRSDGKLLCSYLKREIIEETNELGPSHLTVLEHGPFVAFTISPDDITLDVEEPEPGQTVNVSVQVRNVGDLSATDSQATFYDGDPDDGGTEIGTVPLDPSLIPGGETAVSTKEWTIPDDMQGHDIYVVASSSNGGFFKAGKGVILPDLKAHSPIVKYYLGDGDIVIEIRVENLGPVDVSGQQCDWELRWGENAESATLLYNDHFEIPSIGETKELLLPIDTSEFAIPGRYKVHFVIDLLENFREGNELNNTGSCSLVIGPDLAIDKQNSYALKGRENYLASVTVSNSGIFNAENVLIHAVEGDLGSPNAKVVGYAFLPAIKPGEQRRVNLTFDKKEPFQTAIQKPRKMESGDVQGLWIIVDPGEACFDPKRNNNIAFIPFTPPGPKSTVERRKL